MPSWGWLAVVGVSCLALGAFVGFGFAAWLIGMAERDARRAQSDTPAHL